MKKYFFLFFVCVSASLSAASPVDIQFVIDASGSMAAQVEGQSQMAIAKQSIKETVATIPAHISVSLRAYGHRIPKTNKTESCKDTELMIPFKPLDITVFDTTVEKLQPKGWTPIAYSLEQAGNDFIGKESEHVIILVSDGEETCGGDPIAAAKALLAKGFKVTIHTIGFRVDAKTKAQLQGISNATGGMYFDASDAVSLTGNLTKVTKQALLIDKPEEIARGQEIRGGNQYEEAVPIQPGIEYRLDHHQRQNEYDYFYFDLKRGQSVTVEIATQDKGVRITGQDQATETTNPYAGFRIVGPDLEKIGSNVVIGTQHGKQRTVVTVASGGRYYLLIGNEYDHQHKNSPFSIAIKNHYDGNSDQDAGEDIMNALEIGTGNYSENWILYGEEKDFYKVDLEAGKIYKFTASPNSMELQPEIRLFNADRVEISRENAPNGGAMVRISDFTPKADGPHYVMVTAWGGKEPLSYGLKIEETAAGVAPPVTDATTPSAARPATPPPAPAAAPTTTSAEKVPGPEKVVRVETEKPNNTLLYVLMGLAVLIIIGLIAVIIIMAGKKK